MVEHFYQSHQRPIAPTNLKINQNQKKEQKELNAFKIKRLLKHKPSAINALQKAQGSHCRYDRASPIGYKDQRNPGDR